MTTDGPAGSTLAEIAVWAGQRSQEIEDAGRLPADLVDALCDTNIFRVWVPSIYGGMEGHVNDLLDACELVAYHDGATAWCIMIGGTTGLNGGFLPRHYGEQIFSDPKGVSGGFGIPAGKGVAVDGGLRVSGRWAWGSGTSHCTWIGGGVRIVDADGKSAQLADGSRAPFVFFDRDDVELLDTWHVTGLKGTASTDYQVTDAFVPEGRWVSFAGNPEPVVDSPLYRFSFLGALALGVSSVTIGLARRAVDELVKLGEKRPTGSSKPLASRAPVQSQISEADAAVRSARAFVREVVEECWQSATDDGRMTDEQKRLLRLAANNATERCAHAVDLCYSAAGGTAVYLDSPLQRVFRDVHVATQHGMVAPRIHEPLGRMLFGLETNTSQL